MSGGARVHLDVAALHQKHVFHLDVSVRDLVGVQVGYGQAQLGRHFPNEVLVYARRVSSHHRSKVPPRAPSQHQNLHPAQPQLPIMDDATIHHKCCEYHYEMLCR